MVDVNEVNAVTRESVSCRVGSANRPGQLPEVSALWATSGGTLVVSAVRKLYPSGPELALCTNAGIEVVAQGSQLDPASIVVGGRVVSWKSSSGKRT